MVSWDRLFESHLMSQLQIAPNGSHEEYGQLAARTSGHYLSGRHVIMILLCCFDFSGRHIVPQVAVKSSCAQPAQKGRYLRIREGLKAYLDSPLFASISVATSREGRLNGGPLSENFEVQLRRRRPGYGLKPSGILLN